MAVGSKIDICNMALDHLGKPPITDLDEGSPEAALATRQYDVARRMCLERSLWTFARRFRSLAELSTNPLSDLWEHAYDLPNGLLKVHLVLEAGAMPTRDRQSLPYYLEGGTLYANIEGAWAQYTSDDEDTLRWPSHFDDAVSLMLALRMTPSSTRRSADGNRLREAFREAIGIAIEVDAAQEQESYVVHTGSYADARDGGVWR